MPPVFEVSVRGAEELAQRMAALGPAIKQAENDATVEAGVLMRNRWVRAASGEILHVQTGTYRDSIFAGDPEQGADGVQVRVGVRSDGPHGGTARAYAAIQEYGGTIRPKGHPLLAIPVGRARERANAGQKVSPYDYQDEDTAWIFPKGRRPLFVKRDENDQIEVLFVGADSVTLPARRPMGISFDEIKPRIPGLVDERVRRVAEAFGRG